MEEADDVVVERKGAREMDKVDTGCVAQDPADGGVDEEVERVQLGHVVEGAGEGGVEAGEDGGEGV